jgi:tyrosyl-tRNA synthetase
LGQEKLEMLTLETLDPEVKNKYDLVRSVGEECVTDSELRNLVAKKPGFILYDGFEPSGRMHIAQVK